MALIFKERRKRSRNELESILYSHLINNRPLLLYDYDKKDFIEKGYVANSDVYTIIKKIIDTATVAVPYVYVDDGSVKSAPKKQDRQSVFRRKLVTYRGLKTKELEFASDNDLTELIKHPNPRQTWNDLMGLMRIFYFVQGEMLMYREAGDDGCAISLHAVPANKAEADINSNGEIVSWRIDIGFNRTRTIPGEDVFFMGMPNPVFDEKGGQLRGLSPLISGLKYLQLSDKALEAWVKSVENEGAKGLISPNHPNPELWLNPEQVKETEKRVDQKIHGTDNKNKVVVSGMPLQYTAIGLSPDAMNVVAGIENGFKKLCDIWGVPPALFTAEPTYNNQRIAQERLLKEVILPHLNKEEDRLNQWLIEPFARRDGKNYVLDYDVSDYEALRLQPDDIEKLRKILTANELRVLAGYDEVEEDAANQILVEGGLIPISDLSLDFDVN